MPNDQTQPSHIEVLCRRCGKVHTLERRDTKHEAECGQLFEVILHEHGPLPFEVKEEIRPGYYDFARRP